MRFFRRKPNQKHKRPTPAMVREVLEELDKIEEAGLPSAEYRELAHKMLGLRCGEISEYIDDDPSYYIPSTRGLLL